ncbi:MAG: extracellular solute-binding protein [Anaerolineales bacterium]|nr:extracellular solute-binding protein [Anaerolineales bacterium]
MPSKLAISFRSAFSLLILLTVSLSAACAPPPTTPERVVNPTLPPTLAPPRQPVIEVHAESYGLPLIQDDISTQYAQASVLLQPGDTVQVEITIALEGEFTFSFDSAAADSRLERPEGQLQVDGAFPLSAFQRILFPVFYRNRESVFPKDRYGNDALIQQVRDVRWSKAFVWDVNFSHPYPLRVKLSAGKHLLNFTLSQGALYLGSMYVEEFSPYPDYTQYSAEHRAPETSGVMLILEAETPTYKNDTSVRPASDRNLTVTPYDTYRLLLNTLGGESWIKSGSAVYYTFSVPEDGLYTFTLRALQNTRSNFTVFRRISINGKVPFAQFNTVPFVSSIDWLDVTLGEDAQTPYNVFLRKGQNVLGVEVTNAPYLPAIETIQKALLDINTLSLEIKKLTGNQRDPYKEWILVNYIPDIQTRLMTIAQNLIDDKDILLAINQSSGSTEILSYQMAIDNLLFLAADPDKIPIYMGRLSEGTGSAAQLLGSLLPLLQNQPLALDKIYIHSPTNVPQTPGVPFTTSLGDGIKRFVHSFEPDPYQSLSAEANELEVWVNRPRQYVDLLQLMSDETFTPQTGIRVKFSIMPNESKLVLANAANIQPDIALGVSTNIPYELAIRNTLYDLRTFADFGSFIRIYSPGALLSYIINDSVYAIPETQDFWVTYYRKDILNSLRLPVPHTWNDVIEILPELQRYGMNFNTPLSSGGGQKDYLFTSPYLFNFGAKLYSEDGFSTGLQSEEAVAAVKFMADSFTLYGMPLTTSSFYESFRYGTLPIGVSNVETYIKLMTAAPEIGGMWGIDLYPATVLGDGTQNRYATGSAQTSLMFKNTDKPQEGWQFLKWWMSTETQSEFQERLMLNYGREYLWNSANLEAFSRLDIPQEHKTVILEQWRWLQEPVRLPGSYMQERELSNVWNRIVFDGINPRVAIDRAVIIINREITRKMEEFGYLKDGQRVKEFTIPTIERVVEWMENAN